MATVCSDLVKDRRARPPENEGEETPMRAKFIAAMAVLYLAAANACLAMTVETCTGGVADSPTGIFLSLGLFVLALNLLRKQKFNSIEYFVLIPLTVAIVIEARFAIILFSDTQVRGLSICTSMFREDYGLAEYDSKLVVYAWLLTYLMVCIWMVWIWVRGFLWIERPQDFVP